MLHLIESIERAVADRNYYAAITLSLALPDMAGALEWPAYGNGRRFKQWFHENLGDEYGDILTKEQAWRLRNSFLHQGWTDTAQQEAANRISKQVVFLDPPTSKGIIHRVRVRDVVILDAGAFCTEVAQAARIWLDGVDEDVRRRASKLGAVYQGGNFKVHGVSFSADPSIHL